MNHFPDHPRQRERLHAPRWRNPDGSRGFTCVLDFSRTRRDIESGPSDRAVALVALVALVAFLPGEWVASRPARPLHLAGAAVQLAAWESPTGFLLADDFAATPSN